MTEDAPLGSEGGRFPVFVDDTGRRHRWLRMAGWCVGALAAGYIALFALSLVSSPSLLPLSIPGVGRLLPNAGAPEIGVPGQGRSRVATVVATSSPAPAVTGSGALPSAAPAPASTTPAARPSAQRTGKAHPTAKPTAVPSAAPTGRPTATPTPRTHPTPRGTGKPTGRPTSSHGRSPTAQPQQSHR